jgi:SAM-dependent methyltransferase
MPEEQSDEAPTRGDWRDGQFVHQWHQQDAAMANRLDLARHLTAAVIAADATEPALIIDIGSGPGAYLAVLLDAVPSARGVWTDASTPMLDLARTSLASYGDRVSFEIVDMTELAQADLPTADVIVTSRAAHHLAYPALVGFYRAAYELLSDGGWLANLDHTEPPGSWESRYKQIRKLQRPQRDAPALPKHRHDQRRPTRDENLNAFVEAGFVDVDLVWKELHTCLFMGRKA